MSAYDRLPGPGDFWHEEPGYEQPRHVRPMPQEREPREYGELRVPCLRWNPVTRRAEPGTAVVHEADFVYDPLRDS